MRTVKIGFIFLFLFVFPVLAIQQAQAQASAPAPELQISNEKIQDLIALFENEAERNRFLERLKAIAEVKASGRPEPQDEIQAQGVALLNRFFKRTDNLINDVTEASWRLFILAKASPGYVSDRIRELASSEGRRRLYHLLTGLGSCLIVFLAFRLISLKIRVPRPDTRPKVWGRLWLGILSIVRGMLAPVMLLVSYLIVFQFVDVRPNIKAIIFLVIAVYAAYRLAATLILALLGPNTPERRILLMSDEDSHYLWIWASRLIRFTSIYFLATRLMALLGFEAGPTDLIRGLLLLIFALMLTTLILQLKKEIKARFLVRKTTPAGEEAAVSAEPAEVSTETVDISGQPVAVSEEPVKKSTWARIWNAALPVLRYWWLPALVYVWAIFIMLIGHLGNALGFMWTATWASVLTIIALALALRINNSAFQRLFAVSDIVKTLFPGLEAKALRYLQIVRLAVKGIIIFLGLSLLAQVWGLPIMDALTSSLGFLLIRRIIAIFITLAVVLLLIEAARVLAVHLLEEKEGVEISQKRKTFVPLIQTLFVALGCFVGGMVILRQLGIDVRPILAGAGIIGLGVGLGAQSLVKDLINGMFILMQDLVSVGDVVDIGGKSGGVESVGMRTIRLRDLYGNVHTIPNSTIETVTNMTKGYSRCVIDVGVAYRENVDAVMDLLREIGEEIRQDPVFGPDMLEPMEILGVTQLGDSAVNIRARVMTKPLKQWGLGREFNRRIKNIFDAHGIEIPFPHHTVYLGEPKQGTAPALHVRVGGEEKTEIPEPAPA